MVQNTTLRALASLKQGRDEEISTYIKIFDLVYTRFVGTMLNIDTLKQFFIQRFSKSGTIRGVLGTESSYLSSCQDGNKGH